MRRSACLPLLALLFACAAAGVAPGNEPNEPEPTRSGSHDPVVAAAGDIACAPGTWLESERRGSRSSCRMKETSDLLVGAGLAAVLTLGDEQYEDGSLAGFRLSYDRTWGRLRAITHPVPGNHEYRTPAAAGYFTYFGTAAGDPAKGYYSFDVGAWHLVALNSSCAAVGGCEHGSAEERWLATDLAAHPAACTLAYWHQPRFSSGGHGSDREFTAFWADLYAAGADVVLGGHDHDYERFAPQDPAGRADPRGPREFVVGSGGRNHTPTLFRRANSAVRNGGTFGVLELTLHPDRYDWRFVPITGGRFADAGSAPCHGASGQGRLLPAG